jgi:hypothetical protein
VVRRGIGPPSRRQTQPALPWPRQHRLYVTKQVEVRVHLHSASLAGRVGVKVHERFSLASATGRKRAANPLGMELAESLRSSSWRRSADYLPASSLGPLETSSLGLVAPRVPSGGSSRPLVSSSRLHVAFEEEDSKFPFDGSVLGEFALDRSQLTTDDGDDSEALIGGAGLDSRAAGLIHRAIMTAASKPAAASPSSASLLPGTQLPLEAGHAGQSVLMTMIIPVLERLNARGRPIAAGVDRTDSLATIELKLAQQEQGLTLSLRGSSLWDRGVVELSHKLASWRGTPVTAVDLSDNSIGPAGAAALGLLARTSFLEEVKLSGNRLGSQGLTAFVTALSGQADASSLVHASVHSHGQPCMLRQLDLSSNFINSLSPVGKLLSQFHTPLLHTLDLSFNPLSDCHWARTLAGAQALHDLRLRACSLRSRDIVGLCHALTPLTCLERVDLGLNALGVEGLRAVGEFASASGSLRCLDLEGQGVKDRAAAMTMSGAWGTFLRGLPSRLVGIGLTDCSLDDEAMAELCTAQRESGGLQVLLSDDNVRCSDVGARHLIDWMRSDGSKLMVVSARRWRLSDPLQAELDATTEELRRAMTERAIATMEEAAKQSAAEQQREVERATSDAERMRADTKAFQQRLRSAQEAIDRMRKDSEALQLDSSSLTTMGQLSEAERELERSSTSRVSATKERAEAEADMLRAQRLAEEAERKLEGVRASHSRVVHQLEAVQGAMVAEQRRAQEERERAEQLRAKASECARDQATLEAELLSCKAQTDAIEKEIVSIVGNGVDTSKQEEAVRAASAAAAEAVEAERALANAERARDQVRGEVAAAKRAMASALEAKLRAEAGHQEAEDEVGRARQRSSTARSALKLVERETEAARREVARHQDAAAKASEVELQQNKAAMKLRNETSELLQQALADERQALEHREELESARRLAKALATELDPKAVEGARQAGSKARDIATELLRVADAIDSMVEESCPNSPESQEETPTGKRRLSLTAPASASRKLGGGPSTAAPSSLSLSASSAGSHVSVPKALETHPGVMRLLRGVPGVSGKVAGKEMSFEGDVLMLSPDCLSLAWGSSSVSNSSVATWKTFELGAFLVSASALPDRWGVVSLPERFVCEAGPPSSLPALPPSGACVWWGRSKSQLQCTMSQLANVCVTITSTVEDRIIADLRCASEESRDQLARDLADLASLTHAELEAFRRTPLSPELLDRVDASMQAPPPSSASPRGATAPAGSTLDSLANASTITEADTPVLPTAVLLTPPVAAQEDKEEEKSTAQEGASAPSVRDVPSPPESDEPLLRMLQSMLWQEITGIPADVPDEELPSYAQLRKAVESRAGRKFPKTWRPWFRDTIDVMFERVAAGLPLE